MKQLTTCAALLSVPLAGASLPTAPLLPEVELAALMPERVALYVEAPGLSALCEAGLEHPFITRLLASDIGAALLAEADTNPERALAQLDAFVGQPVLSALAAITAGGVALGVFPRDGEPVWCLAARGDDPQRMRETLRFALARAAKEYGVREELVIEPHATIRSINVWFLGDELAIGQKGSLFLASGDRQSLRGMIDRAAGDAGDGLLGEERFEQAHAGRAAHEELAWAWADLLAFERADAQGLDKLRRLVREPAVHFLLGPAVASATTADVVTLGLRLDAREIGVSLTGRGLTLGSVAALLPSGERRPAELPRETGSEAARAVVYRDLAGIFAGRTELFRADTLPKFAEAISGLALFFGGADVTEDVLPNLSPWLGLVVRDATFDDGAVPEVPLPAVALVARVADPERTGTLLVGAFQTAIGLVNVDGAQKMRPPMVLDIELVGGVPITSARFPKPADGEGVDVRYNLAPACALVGDAFVLGTHRSLVTELAGQIARGEVRPVDGDREHLNLRGAAAADVLHANEEALVMQGVLNEGKSLAESREDIRGITAIARLIERVRISTDLARDAARLALTLELVGGEGR